LTAVLLHAYSWRRAGVAPEKRNLWADERSEVRRNRINVDRRTFHKLAGSAAVGALMNPGEATAGWAAIETPAKSRAMWDHYLLGAAYYPEWWEPSEWEIDFRQMRDLGINTLRMGEFA
jgi:Beta-galactosidase